MKARRWIVLMVLAALVATGSIIGMRLGLFQRMDAATLRGVIDRVHALPYLRLSFVCLYTIAAASGVPATPLTMAGGVLFGPLQGMILNWIADMIAASMAFGLARAFARPGAAGANTKLEGLASRGFLGLLRLRVIPVIPFALLNYGAGVYGMKWRPYLAATAVGVVPSIIVYTMLASSVASGLAGAGRRALITASICAVGIIGLSLLPRLVRSAPKS